MIEQEHIKDLDDKIEHLQAEIEHLQATIDRLSNIILAKSWSIQTTYYGLGLNY